MASTLPSFCGTRRCTRLDAVFIDHFVDARQQMIPALWPSTLNVDCLRVIAQALGHFHIKQIHFVHHAQARLLFRFQSFQDNLHLRVLLRRKPAAGIGHVQISEARCTSSSVARNAETSVCGRLRMNPTVSDIRILPLGGQNDSRIVDRVWRTLRGRSQHRRPRQGA